MPVLGREGVRRFVNVVLAAVGLIVAGPLMLLVAALIKLTSRGPVLYSQPRIGSDRRDGEPRTNGDGPHTAGAPGNGTRDGAESPHGSDSGNGHGPGATLHASVNGNGDGAGAARASVNGNGDGAPSGSSRGNDRRWIDLGGRIFTIYKFRTMRVGADDGEQVWARPDDDRVTPVGRFLRKYHLDELPQLFNVLKGDMNLVGPRPEQPAIFCELADEIPHYPRRQRVLPGLTGWAQIQHHYDRTLDDVKRKLELDLEYLDRRSAMEDIRIMVRTVPAVVLAGEAEGW